MSNRKRSLRNRNIEPASTDEKDAAETASNRSTRSATAKGMTDSSTKPKTTVANTSSASKSKTAASTSSSSSEGDASAASSANETNASPPGPGPSAVLLSILTSRPEPQGVAASSSSNAAPAAGENKQANDGVSPASQSQTLVALSSDVVPGVSAALLPGFSELKSLVTNPLHPLRVKNIISACKQEREELQNRSDRAERTLALTLNALYVDFTKSSNSTDLSDFIPYLEGSFDLRVDQDSLRTLLRYGGKLRLLIGITMLDEPVWMKDMDPLPRKAHQIRIITESTHKTPWSIDFQEKLLSTAFGDWLRHLARCGPEALAWDDRKFGTTFADFFRMPANNPNALNNGMWRRSGPVPPDMPPENAKNKRRKENRRRKTGSKSKRPRTIAEEPLTTTNLWFVDPPSNEPAAAADHNPAAPVAENKGEAAVDVPAASQLPSVVEERRNHKQPVKYTPEVIPKSRRATGGKKRRVAEEIIDLTAKFTTDEQEKKEREELEEKAKQLLVKRKMDNKPGTIVYVKIVLS